MRGLSILQLPCTKVLKKVLKDGAEQPGIDLHYFENQQEKFTNYTKQRESGGHPQPLGIGVLMWDEVKVGNSIIIILLFRFHLMSGKAILTAGGEK